jgi:hypothetical protein
MTEKRERKVWFITRPERDPAFHKEALEALKNATENFSLNWKGNRDLHKTYEKELIEIGLKRNSISNDGSGGRTWAAMLRTFCYCYLNKDGYLVLTKVGQEILNGRNVHENITKQLLTLQIPNAYFLESGFKPQYELNFKILPVRFLLKLCCDERLDFYITKEEITFFAMTAHQNSELLNVITEILNFRQSTNDERKIIKQEIACLYEHRERSDKGARDFESAHSDVAHTFMLITEYSQLVEYIRGQAIRIPASKLDAVKSIINEYDNRYPFNNKYLFSLERMAETNGLDVNSYKASRYGNIKPATNQKKKLIKAEKLLSNKPSLSYDEKVELLSKEFIIKEAQDLANHFHTEDKINSLTDNFIFSYLNEENDLEFENKTGMLLKQIGFNIEMHPSIKGERTEIDILLKYNDNLCGIIDAKNYKVKFQLSSSLSSHMAGEYIYNYANYDGCKLQFFGYVTANDIGGTNNLDKITKIAERNVHREIKGFMINAKSLLAFLDYCIENDIDKDSRIVLFLKLIDNTSYTNFNSILKRIN